MKIVKISRNLDSYAYYIIIQNKCFDVLAKHQLETLDVAYNNLTTPFDALDDSDAENKNKCNIIDYDNVTFDEHQQEFLCLLSRGEDSSLLGIFYAFEYDIIIDCRSYDQHVQLMEILKEEDYIYHIDHRDDYFSNIGIKNIKDTTKTILTLLGIYNE